MISRYQSLEKVRKSPRRSQIDPTFLDPKVFSFKNGIHKLRRNISACANDQEMDKSFQRHVGRMDLEVSLSFVHSVRSSHIFDQCARNLRRACFNSMFPLHNFDQMFYFSDSDLQVATPVLPARGTYTGNTGLPGFPWLATDWVGIHCGRRIKMCQMS